jgi:hypothetical protein
MSESICDCKKFISTPSALSREGSENAEMCCASKKRLTQNNKATKARFFVAMQAREPPSPLLLCCLSAAGVKILLSQLLDLNSNDSGMDMSRFFLAPLFAPDAE